MTVDIFPLGTACLSWLVTMGVPDSYDTYANATSTLPMAIGAKMRMLMPEYQKGRTRRERPASQTARPPESRQHTEHTADSSMLWTS